VLDGALQAHGGEARIRALEDVTVEHDGRRHMEYQSYRLARPWDVQRWRWRYVLDLKGSRFRADRESRYPKDFVFTGRQVVTPKGGWYVDPRRAGMGDEASPIGPEAWNAVRAGWTRDVPPLILVRALDRAATLRSLGSSAEGGRRYDVVTYAEGEGAQIALYVDASTRLLARYETLRDDPIVGDQALAVAFDGYRPVGGLQLPTRRTELRNGEVVQDGTLAIAVDTHPADSVFAQPPGYAQAAPDSVEEEAVRKLGDNVWLLQQLPGGNRAMFVAFKDYVLVVEAPTPQGAGQAAMDAIRRTVPGKPIRYVAITHHHDDHGGGLRPYVAEGVTVVTTPNNRAFVEQVAAARHTLAPDALARAARAPAIETFTGSRRFTDGETTVELIDIGPNSHVEGMVMAWLPKQRLVFQGDLLILPSKGGPEPANTLTTEFLRVVESRGLDVETIAGVHGRVGTIADLRAAVARRVAAAP
jgi:glyoxylase-like metal-dependent hydrolase (beta-lactamase superfamily II)